MFPRLLGFTFHSGIQRDPASLRQTEEEDRHRRQSQLALANGTGASSGLTDTCSALPGGDGTVPEFCWMPSVFVQDACVDGMVSTYLDFARSTASVNADLNAQDHAIPPGSYNYVTMDFCAGTPKSKNLGFKADGMTDVYTLGNKKCGTISDKMASPVVVGEGEAVTISLTYDLASLRRLTSRGLGWWWPPTTTESWI